MVKMAFGIAAALLLACSPDQTQTAADEASPAVETVDVGPEAGSAEEAPAEDVAAPPEETTEEAGEEANEDEFPEGETPADN